MSFSMIEARTYDEPRPLWLNAFCQSVILSGHILRAIAKWDGDTRLSVGFYSKGAEKTQVAVDHEKLPNSKECARMKAYWFEALNRLQRMMEA
jgi:hypothetical protein